MRLLRYVDYLNNKSFSDPPSKPGRPQVIDYDKDKAEIQWTPSLNDGGNPIQKYVIEKRQKSDKWHTVRTRNF